MANLRPITILTTPGSTATLTEETGTLVADGKIVAVRTVTDDAAGNLGGGLGIVNRAGKSFSLRVIDPTRVTQAYQSDYEDAAAFEAAITDGVGAINTMRGGVPSTTVVKETVLPGSPLIARYRVDGTVPRTRTGTVTPPPVVIDLCPYTTHRIVSGSVRFRWMGTIYDDFEGRIYRGRTDTVPGILSGYLNADTGQALMVDYVVGGSGPTDFQLLSLFTQGEQWTCSSIFFTTDVAPLRPGPGGFVMTVVDMEGNTLTANIDGQGVITGPHMRGKADLARGGIQVNYGDFITDATLTAEEKAEWWYRPEDVGAVQAGKVWRPWPVDPTTLRWSGVSYMYLPVDVSLMGIDPAALPPDGLVQYARPGDTVVIGQSFGGLLFTPSTSTPYEIGEERLSFVQVLRPDGSEVFTGYTADLDAGTVTFTDLTDYPPQVKVFARREVYRQIAEVRIDGSVRLTQAIGAVFPVGATFSTALRFGDRFARVTRVYDQASWDGVTWYDGVDPAKGPAVPTYDTINYAVDVSNLGAVTERWALRFRSDQTTFDCYGQHLGMVASGNVNADFSPTNPATGAPYFTLPSAGWGGTWPAGSVLFLDTVGAEAPVAILRCTQPGSPAGVEDSCLLVQRGDVDRAPTA